MAIENGQSRKTDNNVHKTQDKDKQNNTEIQKDKQHGPHQKLQVNTTIHKQTQIMSVFQLGIENGGSRLWKKGTSARQRLKKGNIVIFSYLLLKMSFSTTF